MRLLQKKKGFRFGTDSVLLAAYTAAFYGGNPGRSLMAADLGAGCGAVSLLLSARLPGARLTGIEMNPASCSAFARSIVLNRLEHRLQAVNLDIRRMLDEWPPAEMICRHAFDLVVSNPPYGRPDQSRHRRTGPDSAADQRRPARVETELTLDQLAQAAGLLLKPGGRLVLVHRPHRLPDVLTALHNWRLEVKTLRLVQPLPGRPPAIFLISATKAGRSGGFRIEPPLVVTEEPGRLSPEVASWYGREAALTDEQLYAGLERRDFPEPRQAEVEAAVCAAYERNCDER